MIDQSTESSRFFDSFGSFFQSVLADTSPPWDSLVTSESPCPPYQQNSPLHSSASSSSLHQAGLEGTLVQPDLVEHISLASRICDAHQRLNPDVDITPYLQYPQSVAAKMLHVGATSLSKNWRKVTNNRKWPYRKLKRLDREIATLLRNLKLNPTSTLLQAQLDHLVRSRNQEMKPVFLPII